MHEMGILYYVDYFPKLSESFILNEIVELDDRGHDIAVFALWNPGEEVVHDEYDDLDLPVYYADPTYADAPRVLSRRLLDPRVREILRPAFAAFSFDVVAGNIYLGNQCASFIDGLDFDIDLIHGHFATPRKIGQIYASKSERVPATLTAHAYDIFESPDVEQIRYLCNTVDHVIVPSRYNEQYLTDEIGIENSVTVVPATTKLDKFESDRETVPGRVLTVGRLVEKKGYEYGIDAIAQLVESGHEVTYHIVGTGDREASLRERVRQHDIEESVTFLGHVSDERLRQELGEADIFMLPCVIASDGDRDAMPVVLKEAMAAERPCVSTTVSAIPELITDGEDGLLVPPKDSDALAAALAQLLEDRDERDLIARNGKRTVEETFDIAESVNILENTFQDLS